MPIVTIQLIEGRDREVVGEAMKAVARTLSEQLGAPLSTVRVMVNEVPPELFAVGDVLKSEPAAPPGSGKS